LWLRAALADTLSLGNTASIVLAQCVPCTVRAGQHKQCWPYYQNQTGPLDSEENPVFLLHFKEEIEMIENQDFVLKKGVAIDPTCLNIGRLKRT